MYYYHMTILSLKMKKNNEDSNNISSKKFTIDEDKINNYSSGFVNFLELCLEKDPNKMV